MNRETILRKAIEKAVKNGYKGNLITKLSSGKCVTHCSHIELIFSHDFCKAFWGEDVTWLPTKQLNKLGRKEKFIKRDWQYHLQQMVLEKDPLIYLKKFI